MMCYQNGLRRLNSCYIPIMSSEDDASLIYGLEFQARSLAAQTAETEVTRFMIGTQTLKLASNQIHVIEICEDTGNLTSQIYPHPVGELWHLHWSPHDAQLISSTYNTWTEEGGTSQKSALWKLPQSGNTLQLVSDISSNEDIRACFFHPSDATKVATVSDSKFTIYDMGNGSVQESYSKSSAGKGSQKLFNGKWNPQETGASFATVQESSLKGWDFRSDTEAWCLDQAHTPCARDLDYNRNKQQTLCSAGCDGLVKIWDLRSLASLLSFSGHTHWVWSCRYNPFHDELILSSGSDATGRLWWARSAASEPLGSTNQRDDGPLRVYSAMEDSVYVSEWSVVDAWTFAMLSHDGRLLIHRVPKSIKFDILDI